MTSLMYWYYFLCVFVNLRIWQVGFQYTMHKAPLRIGTVTKKCIRGGHKTGGMKQAWVCFQNACFCASCVILPSLATLPLASVLFRAHAATIQIGDINENGTCICPCIRLIQCLNIVEGAQGFQGSCHCWGCRTGDPLVPMAISTGCSSRTSLPTIVKI